MKNFLYLIVAALSLGVAVPTDDEFKALETRVETLEQRVEKLEALVPKPKPEGFTLSIIGGWRLKQPYCKGGLAIDFGTMKCWTLGHAQTVPLVEYQLPAMGAGSNFDTWPQVAQAKDYGVAYSIPNWDKNYGNQLYAGGLHWQDGMLWMSGKGFYSAGGSYPHTVIQKFKLGPTAVLTETVEITNRPMQAFGGGFIKGGPELLIGCGGYESGQGGRSGPCWMKLDGTIVNEFPEFSVAKELREKREANYSCQPGTWFVPPDGDVGYWFAGRIWGGGLVIKGQTCFWVDQGTGTVGYAVQGNTFGATSQRCLYRYDGEHFGKWEEFPQNTVIGSDIKGDLVYLLIRDGWTSGLDPCPVLACFQVK